MNHFRQPKIHYVAISSQKGGVGKTTTCLSLGASLAEAGMEVLLVDLDPQAHLTQAVGIEPDYLRRSVGDVLLDQANLVEVSRECPHFSLDLVPANRGLILVEKLLNNRKSYEYHLKSSLETLNGQYYDIVLMDCPPSFGPLTLNALTAAEFVLVPITCDFFSARSLQVYLSLLCMVRRNSNPKIEHRLLVTLFDGRTRISKLVMEQYRLRYSDVMFETVIPMDTKLRESPVFSRPITQYASRARSALEYRSLAMELMSCLKVTI